MKNGFTGNASTRRAAIYTMLKQLQKFRPNLTLNCMNGISQAQPAVDGGDDDFNGEDRIGSQPFTWSVANLTFAG